MVFRIVREPLLPVLLAEAMAVGMSSVLTPLMVVVIEMMLLEHFRCCECRNGHGRIIYPLYHSIRGDDGHLLSSAAVAANLVQRCHKYDASCST